MTRADASTRGERVALDLFTPSASSAAAGGLHRRAARGTRPRVVPRLGERRRAQNRQNVGSVTELRCECAIADCRESLPAAADNHRLTENCFIVAPAHLNGDIPVKVADHFFVIRIRE